MPGPPSSWGTDAVISAGQLNYDMYTYDSNQFHPTGINFRTYRPLFYEVISDYGAVTKAVSSTGGTRTNLTKGGSTATTDATATVVYDTSGMWGSGADYLQGTYQFLPTVEGSDGQGQMGGYYLCSHFAEINGEGTNSLYFGADYMFDGILVAGGARQTMSTNRNNCTFILDLIPFGPNSPNSTISANTGNTATPAIWNKDLAAITYSVLPGTSSTTSTGELSRHWAMWAGVIQDTAWGTQSTIGSPQLNWPAGTALTSSLMTSALQEPLQWLGNPVCFRTSSVTAQAMANSTNTALAMPSATVYNGNSNYNATTGVFTVPVAGLYLFSGVVAAANIANSGDFIFAGACINSKYYWGPAYTEASSSTLDNICATKVQIFSLEAGDTVQLAAYQNTGASLNTATATPSHWCLLWLGGNGTTIGQPNTTLTVPDPSFRWQAGTPGNVLVNQFQQHLGNDINWFFNVPYFMGYQTASTNINTALNFTTINFQSQTGIVHGDNGDPWDGWSAAVTNTWQAPADGWYLVTSEQTCTITNAATSPSDTVAGITATSSGGKVPSATPDWYQHMFYFVSNAAPPRPGGATATGLYYLLAGESLYCQNAARQTSGTSTTAVLNTSPNFAMSHMEAVWVGA